MILRVPGLRSARSRSRRAGFTLLEILLASLIAALLLAALYMSLNMTLQQTQASRDAVEAEDLTRGVFNKISIDLNGTLTPLPPKSGGNSAASGGTTSSASSGMPSSAAADPMTTGAAPATADPTTPGATDNATAFTAAPLFQGGVVGQEQLLVLFLGRVPEAFSRDGNPEEQVRSDQRQVIYKFVANRGLYRQERPWVTADNLSLDLDPDSPDAQLLADEVTELRFEFSDGKTWASTWDGTVPGPDGVTPLGPPRAVRVTLTMKIPSGKGELITKQVSQILVVRSAPGTYTPPLLEAPIDGATDGSTTPSTPGGSSGTTPGSGTTPSTTTPSTKTPSLPSGGTIPSIPSGSIPSIPSGSIPSLPSGTTGGSKTGGTTGGTTGGKTGGGK